MSLVALASILLLVAPARAQTYTVDRSTSDALTNYLRQNRLPLVGAQVSRASDGGTQVVLYGFVATDLGKTDAEKKVTGYLNDPNARIIDRIAVRPEIGNLGAPTAASAAGSAPVAGSASAPNSFDELIRQIRTYGVHTLPDENGVGSP